MRVIERQVVQAIQDRKDFKHGQGGYFRDREGNEYKSGHIVWDFSENRIVEE